MIAYQEQRTQLFEPMRDHLRTSPTLLIPQGITGTKSRKFKDRITDSRIRGSDLYVARLCRKTETVQGNEQPLKKASEARSLTTPSTADGHELQEEASPTDNDYGPMAPSSTGSLHEELRFCGVKATADNSTHMRSFEKRPTATQSRPCYRCIFYMHSAGIKRVFWTNAKGEWEGAKVQELVDALDSSGKEGFGGSTKSLFVTKHEVLMLRRAMGSQ